MNTTLILNSLKNSDCALSLVQELKAKGINCDQLNQDEQIGSLVCHLMTKTYGLGIKILLDCGLNMAAQHPITGDTPLLVLCNEGLCGSIQKLIAHLPSDNLLHRNKIGLTALTQLLSRAHGECGCLETLFEHIRLDKILIPHSVILAHLNKFISLNTENHSELNRYNENVCLDSSTHILLTLEQLFNRIRTSDTQRILSVIQIWIKYNLLIFPDHQQTEIDQLFSSNLNLIKDRLIKPMLSLPPFSSSSLNITNIERNLEKIVPKFELILFQLILLDQINNQSSIMDLINFVSSDDFDIECKILKDMLKNLANQLEIPLSLKYLVLRQIRKLFQEKFIRVCCQIQIPNNFHTNLYVFNQWIEKLCLPVFIQKYLLLEHVII